MLTEEEKSNIIELLILLDESDLHSIVSTITNKLVHMTCSEDAIKIIINYSENVKSILTRKKVTKEIIVKYLMNKQIIFNIKDDKSILVNNLIEYWNINQAKINQNFSAQTFANDFTNWYYSHLNSQNGLGKEHYWSNVNCIVLIKSCDNESKLEFRGQDNAYLGFEHLRNNYGLNFNPNKESVIGKHEMHGLVAVFVSGNISQYNKNFIGVFETSIMLAQDGVNKDKWKIKCIDLRIKQTDKLEPLPITFSS